MQQNVIEMSNNVANVKDRLLPETQNIAMQASKFEKQAKELEANVQARNFWAGSPKCLLLFGGTGGLGLLLYYIIMFFIRR